ncbi:uncharacterized protein [Tenebrio molitor]|uniref:Uncharacterized protein n=1 Tax=Tenebrio molitor TaxID=7067 RepID=A0A8J6HNH3_TENMO|nr:hypothetical protein GEV33_004931 [Tenebrio molitor]
MSSYISYLLIVKFLLVEGVFCCGCGCGSPSDFGQGLSYSDLGVKFCGDDGIPPLEMHKPICPPPPSICKELGIAAQPPMYPPPPTCGYGGSWLPLMPRCLRKTIRHPFCISRANLLNQRLALSKLRVHRPGFNLTPLGGGCGCGCGR